MKNKTFLIIIILFVFSLGFLNAQGWYIYDGSQNPLQLDGWKVSSDDPGVNMIAEVLNDTLIPGNKIFKYVQPDYFRADGVTSGARTYYRHDFSDRNPEITIVARLKGMKIDSIPNSNILNIEYSEFADGEYNVRDALVLTPNTGTIELQRANDKINVTADLYDWHVYRITFSAEDSISTIYLDEDETPILTGKSFEDNGSGNNYLRMGDPGSSRIAGYTDFVLIDTSGKYAPGEGAPIPAGFLPLPESDSLLPIAKWSFEETGATVLDSGILGLHGTIVDSGSVKRLNCGVGQSISFLDAVKTSAKVVVPDNEYIDFDSGESFSISCLAKGDYKLNSGTVETGTWFVQKGVISDGNANEGKWYGIELKYYEESYQLRFAIDDQTDKSVATLFDVDSVWDISAWHHIVGVRDCDEDSIKLYLDGVLVASVLDELSESNSTSGQPLNIGNSYDNAGRFKGAIDEVAIYNVALSATDVEDLYNSLTISGDCSVADSIGHIHVSSIAISTQNASDSIAVGELIEIDVDIIPHNAYNLRYSLTADPATVADFISQFSKSLKGLTPGVVTVKAISEDSPDVVSNELVITVYEPSSTNTKNITEQDLLIYPVPASKNLKVKLSEDYIGKTIIISDITGNTLLNKIVDKSIMDINISELNRGLYLFIIKGNKCTLARKIVIE